MFLALFLSVLFSPLGSEIDDAINNRIILCTGPSLGRKALLKETTEKDQKFIPFKKIFLVTNDLENLGMTFGNQTPVTFLIPKKGHQFDCLNCIIANISAVIEDPECDDEDIILFKHESVYVNDMTLVRKAIGKILAGHDMVVKFWTGHDYTRSWMSLNEYYHSDSFFLKVSSARKYLRNHSLIVEFTKDFKFCEEYFTRFMVSSLPNVFQINYYHSSWYDNELGLFHIPNEEEDPSWIWNKENYHQIYD